MDQVLAQTNSFKLSKRSKDGKKWYEIKCDAWCLPYRPITDTNDFFNSLEEVRDFFDPLRNKSGKNGTRWKYKNRKDAEQMYTMAIMRWS